ncbi:MAG: DegT/DnrJ/EryC1/StrS family aminotransferase [Dehalococcoidia bacterium]|nr:DegT/DnrJ/EryC1/StrS family aminotransferase [Dehalococcoidia bacterium]
MIPRYSLSGYLGVLDIFSVILASSFWTRDRDNLAHALDELERRIAGFCGCKFGVLTASARGGLYDILQLRPEIWNVYLQPYTCRVVPDTIRYAGRSITFVDIELTTYGLDCERLTHLGQLDGAMILTHLYGCPARDTFPLIELARKNGVFIIEDGAQALGACLNGRQIGSIGDCAIFSFDSTKPIPLGAGGIITTNDEELYSKLKHVQEAKPELPRKQLLARLVLMALAHLATLNDVLYNPVYTLRNKLGNVDSRITMPEYSKDAISSIHTCRFPKSLERLAKKLVERCDELTRARMERARIYDAALDDREGVAKLPCGETEEFRNTFLRYPIRIAGINREELVKRFTRSGVDVGDWFYDNILHYPQYKGLDSYCPNSDAAYETVVNLPIHGQMRRDDLDKVCDIIAQIVDKQRDCADNKSFRRTPASR